MALEHGCGNEIARVQAIWTVLVLIYRLVEATLSGLLKV
jgi:hypothetical protein